MEYINIYITYGEKDAKEKRNRECVCLFHLSALIDFVFEMG